MLNKVTIMGRISRELELKSANNIPVVSFGVAVDRNYKSNGEYPTDFFNVVAWRKTAEFICKFFAKGQMIAIDGTLQTRKYTDKNNVVRDVTEIIVDSAFFCEGKKDTSAQDNSAAPAAYYNQASAGAGPAAYNQAAVGAAPAAYAQAAAAPVAYTQAAANAGDEFPDFPSDFAPDFGNS